MEKLKSNSNDSEIMRLGCRVGGSFTKEEIALRSEKKIYTRKLNVVRK